MSGISPAPSWTASQQAWLQAMGYAVYLHGGALDALPPAQDEAPAVVANEAVAVRKNVIARREPAPRVSPHAPVTTPEVRAVSPRRGAGPRLPDRLQIALLRASGCNPNDPQTRVLMEGWPLAELRASPAAKRALWPQLRALRRKQRQ
ncbi:MAG: alanine acetyltransferase [Stenotrophomonas sp.]